MTSRILFARGINTYGQIGPKGIEALPNWTENLFFYDLEVKQIAPHFGTTFVLARDLEGERNRLFRMGTGLRSDRYLQGTPVNASGLFKEPPLFSWARVKHYLGVRPSDTFIYEIRLPDDKQNGKVVPGMGSVHYLLESGEAYGVGDNSSGKLGVDVEQLGVPSFKKIPHKRHINDLKVGSDFTIFLDGRIKRSGPGVWLWIVFGWSDPWIGRQEVNRVLLG